MNDLNFANDYVVGSNRFKDSMLNKIISGIIKDQLMIDKIDKKLSIVSLTFKDRDEQFAKSFVENLASNFAFIFAPSSLPKSVYGRVVQFDRQTDILTRVSCAGWTRATCTSVPGSEEKIVVSDEVNATVVASDEETGEDPKEDPRTGRIAGDHRGHLIGKALGGAGDESNLFSQNPGMNQGAFRVWEGRIRGVLTENPTWSAQINISLKYPLPMRHPLIRGIYSLERYV